MKHLRKYNEGVLTSFDLMDEYPELNDILNIARDEGLMVWTWLTGDEKEIIIRIRRSMEVVVDDKHRYDILMHDKQKYYNIMCDIVDRIRSIYDILNIALFRRRRNGNDLKEVEAPIAPVDGEPPHTPVYYQIVVLP